MVDDHGIKAGLTCFPPEDSVHCWLDVSCQSSPSVQINQVEAAFIGGSQAVVFISGITENITGNLSLPPSLLQNYDIVQKQKRSKSVPTLSSVQSST